MGLVYVSSYNALYEGSMDHVAFSLPLDLKGELQIIEIIAINYNFSVELILKLIQT